MEVTVVTSGVMQIGWATRNNSKFLNHEGYGIGDDEYSLAYDGCRQLIWYNAASSSHSHPCWKSGDVLGTLLDVEHSCVIFYLNGNPLSPYNQYFRMPDRFLLQQALCHSNNAGPFWPHPFKFPPTNMNFQSFNNCATLPDEEKLYFQGIKLHIRLEKLRQTSVREDSCSLCFDGSATIRLDPCQHTGFCVQCALQLLKCVQCVVVKLMKGLKLVEISYSNAGCS
ncbi:RING finger and SPRY domain-containing protein 1 [Caerostris extrusa]|uniref:RING finger and SPRY domain-containing protein 1 n=1 Tax=Caerostris extrusa TaxID=172846 RepID=A0AAV4M3H9_CAEEX|nr:RING finger and SPRY domain-containing protein 1 [Caerostris extrusa]